MKRKDLILGIIGGLILGVFVTQWLAPRLFPHINIPKLKWDDEPTTKSAAYKQAYRDCLAAMEWSESEIAALPHMSVETSFDGMPQWQHIAPGQVAHIIVENGKYISMKVISTKGEDLGTKTDTRSTSVTSKETPGKTP